MGSPSILRITTGETGNTVLDIKSDDSTRVCHFCGFRCNFFIHFDFDFHLLNCFIYGICGSHIHQHINEPIFRSPNIIKKYI